MKLCKKSGMLRELKYKVSVLPFNFSEWVILAACSSRIGNRVHVRKYTVNNLQTVPIRKVYKTNEIFYAWTDPRCLKKKKKENV